MALAATKSESPAIQSSVFFSERIVLVRYLVYGWANIRSCGSPPTAPNIWN